MTKGGLVRERGLWNSSITRVRPVFTQLLQRDPSGVDWLERLIDCAPNTDCVRQSLTERSAILSECTVSRSYPDRVLQNFGISAIDLPKCFEHDLAPPTAFLRWLVLNPDRMTWPTEDGLPRRYGPQTQRYREQLVGKHGADLQTRIQVQAQHLIDKKGAAKSRRKWWAFEGFTSVDCWLETEKYILLVEGKRREQLSTSTDWYPLRNQLIRNLEAASEFAHTKNYGVLLVVESKTGVPSISEMLADSLPHLNSDDRSSLATHYLGAITWREVCEAADLDLSTLPDTTLDVVEELKGRES